MSYHYELDGPSRTLLSAIVGRIDDCELEELYFGTLFININRSIWSDVRLSTPDWRRSGVPGNLLRLRSLATGNMCSFFVIEVLVSPRNDSETTSVTA
jgi:hypothetical protein